MELMGELVYEISILYRFRPYRIQVYSGTLFSKGNPVLVNVMGFPGQSHGPWVVGILEHFPFFPDLHSLKVLGKLPADFLGLL